MKSQRQLIEDQILLESTLVCYQTWTIQLTRPVPCVVHWVRITTPWSTPSIAFTVSSRPQLSIKLTSRSLSKLKSWGTVYLDWNINTPSTVYSHITPLSTRSPPFIRCFLHHVPNPSNPPSPPHLKPRPSQQTDQEQHCRRNSISSRQVTTTWRFLLPVEVVKHSSRGPIPGSGTKAPATPPNSALHPSTQAF